MQPFRSSRVVALTLGVLAVLAAAACSSLTKPAATYASLLSTYELTAFTGASTSAVTAISFLGGASRADANFAFDVAVDLDGTGHPVIYPVRTVASDLAGSMKRVGLQLVSGPFDAVREVPSAGYDTLTAKTINVGDVLAVQLLDLTTCLYSLGGQNLYAKLTIDSVNTTSRRLYGRTVIDPNCGYRGVVPDSIPSN
jgi:hypothetical protein